MIVNERLKSITNLLSNELDIAKEQRKSDYFDEVFEIIDLIEMLDEKHFQDLDDDK